MIVASSTGSALTTETNRSTTDGSDVVTTRSIGFVPEFAAPPEPGTCVTVIESTAALEISDVGARTGSQMI